MQNEIQVCFAVCALAAGAAVLSAQVSTNAVRWLKPTNRIDAARSRYPLGNFGRIATNTPAFEEYGIAVMLAEANRIRSLWQLEIPKPLTIDDIVFSLKPTAVGIDGQIGTRDGRYTWSFVRNALDVFADHRYRPTSFRYNDDESARLAKIKSLIDTNQAEGIAKDALHKLGITEERFGLKQRPEVNQYTFEETNGVVYPLPVFDVTWRFSGPTQYSAENLEYRPFNMTVSGITKKVVNYVTPEPLGTNSPIPRWPMPTNYFEMLALPTNYLDTVPERQRALWGLPPPTNSHKKSP